MSYHICIRILFPSTMIVFILKSIPVETPTVRSTMYTVSSRYFKKQPADANNDLKVGRFAGELTDRRYVRSVKFVVGKSTQNASLPYSRISNEQNFEQIIVTLRHISLIQLYGQSTA